MEIFRISKLFRKRRNYSFSRPDSQIIKISFRDNLAEAFRKRRYPKSFISKLSDCEGEAAETQVWLDYALGCEYIDHETHFKLYDQYDHILGMLVNMSSKPENWSW
ncbi:MAG: four helix bundle protein [Bacteroidales bacterium]|nr:four helix bundle protein [Bacteroidales bacterium]